MSDLLPADKAAKEHLEVFAREPAIRSGFCHHPDCQGRYREGDQIVQARWGPGPQPWGTFHARCYDNLPDGNGATAGPQGIVTRRKLPDGARHQRHRYAVAIDGEDVFYSGLATDADAVARFCRDYFGLRTP